MTPRDRPYLPITVVIPVGPDPMYRTFLNDAIESVQLQWPRPPGQILFIDDQANLPELWYDDHHIPSYETSREINVDVYRMPWLSGVAHSFNAGVSLATFDLVFMMGSDDKLEPHCLADCFAAYERAGERPGYYWVDVVYSDNGEEQRLPCNAAMVHKDMWRSSGGFPVESAVGPCDTMLISILMVHPEAGALFHVESETPPYWYRRHEYTYSRVRGSKFGGVHSPVRDMVTKLWVPPQWTKDRYLSIEDAT